VAPTPVAPTPVAPTPVAQTPVAPAPVAAAPVNAPVSPPPPPASKPAPAPHEPERPRSQWHDGSYTGWGTSRHGDIEATVVVADGRIVSAQISRCLTRYSCSWIAHLQQQVVVRQSADVDFVSGATQSTNAFYYAVVEALNKSR
ncbi:MAG: FMN-binding protein, partial [Gemmatimonadetes bacterium]|nr:FMN-binding protein [Gemmatimonadota bacterium]